VAVDWTGSPGLVAILRAADTKRVWIALHGTTGEDGCVQGLLECERIAYTGSGVLASALGMDKIAAKRIWQQHDIATPRWMVVRSRHEMEHWPFAPPWIVKPRRQGSSCGVALVERIEDLPTTFERARAFGADVLLEEYISGREITVAVLDDEVLGIVEIVFKTAIYDWNAKYKYEEYGTQYRVPAPLPPDIERRVRALALGAHRALGCRGLSRSDLRLSPDGRVYVLEINTLPGCGKLSLVTKLAALVGLSYEDLVERILEGAGLDR
jgi:D-alanine-D-alanine ligase